MAVLRAAVAAASGSATGPASQYATLGDVQDRMPQFLLTSTSKPTSVSAEAMLADVHAEVDGVFSNVGYVIPVTGAQATQQARAIVCNGAIARILRARAAAVGGESIMASAERHQKLYEEALLALANQENPWGFVDAPMTPGAVEKGQGGTAPMGLTHDEDGCPIRPRATMDMIW